MLSIVAKSRRQVMAKGMRNRKVGSHELNLESSRSHSLMTVHVESSPTSPDSPDFGHTRHGKITFVDLAGRCGGGAEP
jgi:hypothetical protein